MLFDSRTNIGSIIPLATEGSIFFAGAGGVLAQNNTKFFWDNSNENLYLGTNTGNSASKLHIYEAAAAANVRIESGLADSNASFRLITDGSLGVQHWNFQSQGDAGGIEKNRFVIKDVTAQTEPFTILPGTLADTLYLTPDGVGICTDIVTHKLTLNDDTANAMFVGQAGKSLEFDANGGALTLTSATITPFLLTGTNSIGTYMRFDNTSQSAVDAQWYMGSGTVGIGVGAGDFIFINEDISKFPIQITQSGFTAFNSGGISPTEQVEIRNGNLWLPIDDDNIILGASKDFSMLFNSSNNSVDFDVINGVDVTTRFLTDNNGVVEIGKAGHLSVTATEPSIVSGISYYYGATIEATRTGTLPSGNVIGNGTRIIFNEGPGNATRGITNLTAAVNYTGDGSGSLYGINNANFSISNNSAATTNTTSSMTAGSFSFSMRNSGNTTLGRTIILNTSIASGGPFSGTHTTDVMYGLNMGGSFGNGSGVITVNDTFSHLAAVEFVLQPTDSTVTVDFNNATNVFIERMLYGTQRSAFHMATSGSAIGGDLLFGKQGNASIVCPDGGGIELNPKKQIDAVATIAINNGGTNYVVDGIHTIDGGGGGNTARVQVTSVSSGVVTGVQIIDIGKDYSDTTGAATSQESAQMGGDDNLTLNITVNANPGVKIFSTSQLQFNDVNSYINDDGTDLNIVTDGDLQVSCGTDKTLELQEAVYDDWNVPAVNLKPGASSPGFIPILASGGIYGWGFNGGVISEELHGSSEALHRYKEGTDLIPHVHWMPTTANAGNVKWFLEYSWVNVDGTFSAPTIISLVDAASGTAWTHQIHSFSAISGTGKTINSHLVWRIYRTPNDAEDTYGDDAVLLTVGFHYEVDTLGSRQLLIK